MTPDVLITSYLAMNAPSDFIPAYSNDPALRILECAVPLPAFYRFLYGEVGRVWRWFDRLEWSDDKLEACLAAPNISLWVLYVNGTPAGYIELDAQSDGTEIAYFGLIERFFWARLRQASAELRYSTRLGYGRGAGVGSNLQSGWPLRAGKLSKTRLHPL